jgi:hypothetical protein
LVSNPKKLLDYTGICPTGGDTLSKKIEKVAWLKNNFDCYFSKLFLQARTICAKIKIKNF